MLNFGTQNAPVLWLSCALAAMTHGIRLVRVIAPSAATRTTVPSLRRWITATVTT